MRVSIPIFGLILALLGSVGYGNSTAPVAKTPVYPVSGRLIVSGIPAGKAQIAFHSNGSNSHFPVAITRPDGTFQLTTFTLDDGAPAGVYSVTIIWPNEADPIDDCICPDPARHDHLYGAYSDPAKSQIRVTVLPESNEIELRAEVGTKGWNLPRKRN